MNDNLPVQINYNSPEVIKTLTHTVAHGLNQPEFLLFVEHCKATGLNPFKKEVWAIKAGGRLQIMTGNQGFHTIANRNSQYDGMETGFVGPEGEYLPMTYPRNDFIGAWAKVYRKDRKIPLEAVAMLNEYDKGQGNWKVMRRIMIVKCAESLALRKAFPQELNGIYSQEEMPAEFHGPAVQSPVAATQSVVEPQHMRYVREPEQLAAAPDLVTQKGDIKEEMKPIPIKLRGPFKEGNERDTPLDSPGFENDPPELTPVKRKSGPKYAKQPAQESVTGFEGYKYRYHLPYQKNGVDMNALRKELREKHGFRFNQEDKCWYSNEIVDSVKEYLRDTPAELHKAGRGEGAPIGIPEFDNDPMPDWDPNDIPF